MKERKGYGLVRKGDGGIYIGSAINHYGNNTGETFKMGLFRILTW